jgi:hypothetical protein
MAKEVGQYWRRVEKERREAEKIEKKMEMERAKREEEVREAKRQQKKLNFLLTQTELFSHFISRKVLPNQEISETSNAISEEVEVRSDNPFIVVPIGKDFTKGGTKYFWASQCSTFWFFVGSLFSSNDFLILFCAEEFEENEKLQKAAMERSANAFQRQMENINSFDEHFEHQRSSHADSDVSLFLPSPFSFFSLTSFSEKEQKADRGNLRRVRNCYFSSPHSHVLFIEICCF